MSLRLWTCLIFIVHLAASTAAQAVDPFVDWKTLESPHFLVHFEAPHQDYAERAADIAEAAHERLTKELNWTPVEKTHLVLSDETDFANGFASVIHINRSVIYFAPPTGAAGLEDFDNWLDLLITHEYTHVLHLDKASGSPAGLRNLFGRFLLSFPNNFQPSWLIEGLATWKETDTKRGIGRGQSTLFASIMRTEVANGIKPVDKINLPIRQWPTGLARYLYGVYFFEFIVETQSPQQVQALVEEYSSNLIPFAVNTTFEKIFGKDVTDMWSDYSAWLKQRFQPQIDAIGKRGIIEGERITHDGYRTGAVRIVGDTLYFVEDSGERQATLVKVSGEEKVELAEVVNANFDVANNGDVLISTLQVCNEYNLYTDLYVYREASGTLQRITECGRYVRAVWNPQDKTIIALKHEAAKFALELLDNDGKSLRQLTSFKPETIVGWFDISPDATQMVFSMWKPGTGWNLYLYNMGSGDWQAVTRNSQIQVYPEFTTDGKAILYSSEADYAFNLFRYDLASGKHRQLTRVPGGAFQSSSNTADIYYTGYSAQGTDVYRLATSAALLQPATQPTETSPLQIRQFPHVETTLSAYTPWQSLRPRWWFPVVQLSEDTTEIGLTTSANDALGIHNYFASASYDFSNSLPAFTAAYGFSNRFSISLSRDNKLLKTTNSQLSRIRSENDLQFVFNWPNTQILQASNLLLALSWQNNFDSKLFNGATPAADFNDNMLGLAWLYRSSRIYPLSISQNEGRDIRLVAEDGSILNSDLSGEVYTASWREYIPLGGEHVLALRALQGLGNGVTSSFTLGGEDTGIAYDLLLQQSHAGLFGRRDYALRGYAEGLPQLRGQNARILSAEWRFPGQRIERGIMAPPVGIMQWSGSLFAETGAAYDGASPDKYYSSAGLELTADLNLFYLVPLRARLGLARGFDETIGETRAYLSLGSSF